MESLKSNANNDLGSELILNVFDGDYGLASLHIESLQSLLYVEIAALPLGTRILNNAKDILIYSAPSLIHGRLTIKSFNDIVVYLKTLNFDLDAGLSAKLCSKTFAITNSVLADLKPAIEFMYWLDQRNFDEFTNLWCMKALPCPVNYIWIQYRKHKAAASIETVYPNETELEDVKVLVISKAIRCVDILSRRLGTADYFHGSRPTTIDVLVYSYIAPVLKLPFPSNDLQQTILTLYPNLNQFVRRIDEEYFPNLIESQPRYITKDDKPAATTDEDISYIAMFLVGFSATSLMFYAYNKGVFRLRN